MRLDLRGASGRRRGGDLYDEKIGSLGRYPKAAERFCYLLRMGFSAMMNRRGFGGFYIVVWT